MEIVIPGQRILSRAYAADPQSLRGKSTPRVLQQVQAGWNQSQEAQEGWVARCTCWVTRSFSTGKRHKKCMKHSVATCPPWLFWKTSIPVMQPEHINLVPNKLSKYTFYWITRNDWPYIRPTISEKKWCCVPQVLHQKNPEHLLCFTRKITQPPLPLGRAISRSRHGATTNSLLKRISKLKIPYVQSILIFNESFDTLNQLWLIMMNQQPLAKRKPATSELIVAN